MPKFGHGTGSSGITSGKSATSFTLKYCSSHLFRLAKTMHNLLDISLAPSVLASLWNISTKYNIIICLWTHGFHKLLESLRRASFTSFLALKHLQDFIYYAYTFYTVILELQSLLPSCVGWLEALGDLAHYHLAVATMVTYSQGLGPGELMTTTVSTILSAGCSNQSLPPSLAPDQCSDVSVKSSSMSKKPAAVIIDPRSVYHFVKR